MTKIYQWIVLVKELLDQDTLITKLKAQEHLARKYEEEEAKQEEAHVDLSELD